MEATYLVLDPELGGVGRDGGCRTGVAALAWDLRPMTGEVIISAATGTWFGTTYS